MELTFINGIIIGMFIAMTTRNLIDWWRSRYVIVKRLTMQDYANKDMNLTLSTLYPLEKKESNYVP